MTTINVYTKKKKDTIHKEVYGHFAEHLGRCIYEGIYVGEDSKIENIHGMRCDVVDALRQIKVPVIRWPGGCFADTYHWMDGIGPKDKRKRIVNTNWGNVVEDNSFGTHEYFELCEQVGCEAYVNGNLGSGTVQEMAEWVEYITNSGDSPMSIARRENGHNDPWRLKFFAVGNESWGCGGNMIPEYYANEYRKYQSFLNDSQKVRAQRIAVGPSMGDERWTKRLLAGCYDFAPEGVHGFMEGLSLHYYMYVNGFEDKRSATEFSEDEWYQTMKSAYEMEELIRKNETIMDEFDPKAEIALVVDEWGNWFDSEPGTNPAFLYQQNTMRDAVTAGMNLNIFNEHAKRVTMANIAQMVNVLQAVILTEGEKMVKTPTYHVFDMYKVHQDATLIDSDIMTKEVGTGEYKVPMITKSVSIDSDEVIHITMTNQSMTESEKVSVKLYDIGKITSVDGTIITGKANALNTFEDAESVKIVDFNDFEVMDGMIEVNIPACSVVLINVK